MSDAPRITVDELKRRMETGEDFTLIDVRNPRDSNTAGQARRKSSQNPQEQTCSDVLHLTRRRL
jgi:hypothetical protein